MLLNYLHMLNPNRLVKVTGEKLKHDDFIGYFFDSITGEIIEPDSVLNADDHIYTLTDCEYPLYEGQN